jgi:hypothetical protein
MFPKHIEVQHATHTHVKVTLDHFRKQAAVSVYPVTVKSNAYGTSERVNLSMTQWEDFTQLLEPMPRRNKKRLEQLLEEQLKKIKAKDETSEVYHLFQKCLAL